MSRSRKKGGTYRFRRSIKNIFTSQQQYAAFVPTRLRSERYIKSASRFGQAVTGSNILIPTLCYYRRLRHMFISQYVKLLFKPLNHSKITEKTFALIFINHE